MKIKETKVENFLPVNFGQSAWYQHIPFAYWLIENLKPRSFMEMGTHNGISYFAFCEAISQLKIETKCVAIDNWIGDSQAGIFDESVFTNFVENNKKYSNFSSYIKSDFDKALIGIEDNSIELLHIDGFHSYNQVSTDFRLGLQKVDKEKGIILIHDINEYQITFGVNKFWRELESEYKTMRFNHGHGLGVVMIGNNIDPKVLEIFEKSNQNYINNFQDYFEFLGQRCELYAENINLKNTINDQSKQILAQLSEINKLSASKSEIERDIYRLTNSISWKLTGPLRKLKRILK